MEDITKKYFYDENGSIIRDKQCLKCKEVKPFSEFKKSKSGKYHLHNWCFACVQEYNKQKYQETKDKKKRQVEMWAIENRDKVLEYKREYYYKKHNKEMPPRKEKKIEEINPLNDLPPLPQSDPLDF